MDNLGGLDLKSLERALQDPASKNVIVNLLKAQNKNVFEFFNTKSPVRKITKTKNICESPTALLRRRELHKLTASETNQDNVEVCSKSSESSTSSPIPFKSILQNVVAYVEINRNGSDKSAGAKALLKSMGATVREQFTKDVTHVIFKDGSYDTYNRAKLLKVHFVSVLWLEASRRNNTKELEKNYPALRTKNYDHNVSLICSQMQKEYEDVIRSEIRRSLNSGTSLPSTKYLIENQSSSFQNDNVGNIVNKIRGQSQSLDLSYLGLGNVSPLSSDASDVNSEASSIILETSRRIQPSPKKNRESNKSGEEMDMTCLNDSDNDDCRSLISGRRILQNSTDMELTRLDTPRKTPGNSEKKRKFSDENSSDDEVYNLCTPKLTSGIFTKPATPKNSTGKFQRRSTRKTIEISNIEDSTTDSSCSNMSLDNERRNKRNRNSNMSENSLKNVSLRLSCDKEKSLNDAKKNGKTGLNMSSENGGKNRNKSSDMSSLRLSSDKEKSLDNAIKNSKTSLNMSPENGRKNRSKSSNMSSLRLSSDKEKSLPDATKSSRTSSNMSSLRLSSENARKTRSKSSEMSSLRLSSDKEKPIGVDAGTNRLEKRSKSSNMSSLRLSSDKEKSQAETSSNMLKLTAENVKKYANSLEKPGEDNNSTESFVTANDGLENEENCDDFSDEHQPRSTRRKTLLNNEVPTKKKARIPLGNASDNVENTNSNRTSRKFFENKQEDNGNQEKCDNHTSSTDSRNVIIQENIALVQLPSRKSRRMTISQKNNSENSRPKLSRSKSESQIETRIVTRRRKLFDPNDATDLNTIQDDDEEREEIRETKTLKLTQKTDGIFQSGNVLLSQKAAEWLEKNNEKGGENLKKIIATPKINRQPSIINRSSDRQSQLIREFVDEKTELDVPKTPRTRNIKNQKALTEYRQRRSTLEFQIVENLPRTRAKLQFHEKPTIVCTKFHKPEVEIFTSIVKKLGRFEVENEVSSRTTHLVVGEPLRTINMLRALARGIWILKKEWLFMSLEKNKWLPEEKYELVEFSPAVQRCRLERAVLGPQYTMNIFLGLGRIYIAPSTTPRRSDLRDLVILCEGKITKNKNLAQISVGVKIQGCESVTEYWILDSIRAGKLRRLKKYPLK